MQTQRYITLQKSWWPLVPTECVKRIFQPPWQWWLCPSRPFDNDGQSPGRPPWRWWACHRSRADSSCFTIKMAKRGLAIRTAAVSESIGGKTFFFCLFFLNIQFTSLFDSDKKKKLVLGSWVQIMPLLLCLWQQLFKPPLQSVKPRELFSVLLCGIPSPTWLKILSQNYRGHISIGFLPNHMLTGSLSGASFICLCSWKYCMGVGGDGSVWQ